MRLSTSRRHRCIGDDGAVAILVAIFAIVMFGFAAIIVDLGVARVTAGSSQNAADASVLAAANALYGDDAVTGPNFPAAVSEAKAYAEQNFGTEPSGQEWPACIDPDHLPYTPGNTQCISFNEAANPTTVRVRIPTRDVGSFFGGVVNYDGLSISTAAEASTEIVVNDECVVCVFGEINVDHPDGRLNVVGGGSVNAGHLNMHDHAVESPGKITVAMPGRIAATTADPESDIHRYEENPPTLDLGPVVNPITPGEPPGVFPDPMPAPRVCDAAHPLTPDSYGDITVPGGQTCLFQDGVYRIGGKVKFPGGADLVGDKVTLYFICTESPGCGPPGTRLEGSGTVTITGWDTGVWNTANVSLRYASGVHGPQELGGGQSKIAGAIYAPGAHLTVHEGQSIDAHRIVADKLDIHREAELNVTYSVAAVEPSEFGLSK